MEGKHKNTSTIARYRQFLFWGAIVVVLAVLFGIFLWLSSAKSPSDTDSPESGLLSATTYSETCLVCTAESSIAPVLLDLYNGSIEDVWILPDDDSPLEEGAEPKEYGCMYVYRQTFFTGATFPDDNFALLTFRMENLPPYEESRLADFLCADCAAQVAELAPTVGLVFVGLSEQTGNRFYPIVAGASYDLQYFTIAIDSSTAYDRYRVTIQRIDALALL